MMRKYSVSFLFLVSSLLFSFLVTPVIASTPPANETPIPTNTPEVIPANTTVPTNEAVLVTTSGTIIVALLCLLLFMISVVIYVLYKYWRLKKQMSDIQQQALIQFEVWKLESEQSIRQDAAKRSQAVSIGKMTEHVSPYLPDFTFSPKEARFIGTPIDLIVFDGLDDGYIRNIVFVEVKTGKSRITERERIVKEAVMSRKIQWLELRINQE